jgi:nucleotide-binding universal stress UspA family protein
MSSEAAPRRILAATDLSEPSAEAIRQAHAQALAVDGVLGVCHVLPSPGVHMLFPQRYAREAVEDAALSEWAADQVSLNVTSITGRPAGSFEIFVEHGTDYAGIVRRAETWGAALVVVGSQGRAGALGVLLGSVAAKVVRYAPCPVLVARPPAGRGLVLAATDLSGESLLAVEAAVAEARRRRAQLAVLHAVDQGAPLASVAPSIGVTPLVLSPEMLCEISQVARATIDATVAKLGAQAQVTIVEGPAAPAILQYVAHHRPELVVVGTRGRTGLARIALGSVAEHVVRGAQAPVLVVRGVP